MVAIAKKERLEIVLDFFSETKFTAMMKSVGVAWQDVHRIFVVEHVHICNRFAYSGACFVCFFPRMIPW